MGHRGGTHRDHLRLLHVRADCNILVSCSFDGTVRTWDMRTKECTAVFNSADAPTGALGGGGPPRCHSGRAAKVGWLQADSRLRPMTLKGVSGSNFFFF